MSNLPKDNFNLCRLLKEEMFYKSWIYEGVRKAFALSLFSLSSASQQPGLMVEDIL